ncbi:MAG: hypothetical protein NTZ35_04540 [Ignavibacteriales bacterium]|nr:hypothetical protein [Ignavibacteriales bacterium]
MKEQKQSRSGEGSAMAPPTKNEIAAGILTYLKQHPTAADTVEGIAKWWLLQPTLGQRVNTVEEVLHELEERSLVESIISRGKRLYRAKSRSEGNP